MKFSNSITLFASFLGLSLFALIHSSCTSGSGGSGGGAVADTGYGPFDSRGTYVEAWADNPEKWNRRPTTTPIPDIEPDPEPTLLASNDTPPPSLTPISSGPVEVARLRSTTTISNTSQTRTTSISTNASSSTTSKPKTTSTVKKTTTKPKTVATKSRSSSSARVVVKKGDTLSGLASRHHSSVGAIQKANSMRDTKLVIGRSLVIPRM